MHVRCVPTPRSSHKNDTIMRNFSYRYELWTQQLKVFPSKGLEEELVFVSFLRFCTAINIECFILKINWMVCWYFWCMSSCLLCTKFDWFAAPFSSILCNCISWNWGLDIIWGCRKTPKSDITGQNKAEVLLAWHNTTNCHQALLLLVFQSSTNNLTAACDLATGDTCRQGTTVPWALQHNIQTVKWLNVSCWVRQVCE